MANDQVRRGRSVCPLNRGKAPRRWTRRCQPKRPNRPFAYCPTLQPAERHVELTQIRYFVMLCSERNFTKAARRCGVSQPSLSNGIKALESELGGQLRATRLTRSLPVPR